jgi:hypothetical protein
MARVISDLKAQARILHRHINEGRPAAVARARQLDELRDVDATALLTRVHRRHFFITDRHFIETLGLDPDDPQWELIGRDWVKPSKVDARERLYVQLFRRRTVAGPALS